MVSHKRFNKMEFIDWIDEYYVKIFKENSFGFKMLANKCRRKYFDRKILVRTFLASVQLEFLTINDV